MPQQAATPGLSGEARPAGMALQDFEPLWKAEQQLLESCLTGGIAKVGYQRPRAASPEVALRAEFVAFLARGGAPGARPRGRRIQLMGAWIVGRLKLVDTAVPVSLWFYRCHFDTTLLLDAARIAGSLGLPDCSLPGLRAEACVIVGELALNSGCSVQGEVRLSHAKILRDLNLERAQLGIDADRKASNTSHPLVADGARIGGDLILSGGFAAIGELRFVGVTVGGDIRADQARLTARIDSQGGRGDALNFDRIVVAGNVYLDTGFSASGRVRLQRARIEGHLDCTGADFDAAGDLGWDQNPALLLERTRIGGTLCLRELQTPLLGASLSGARAGALADDASSWGQRLVLDDFKYHRFAQGAPVDAAFRLDWLARQEPLHLDEDYRPEPWRRLISVLRRNGRAHGASLVFMQRERHLGRIGRIAAEVPAALRWLPRACHWLYGVVAGYGERPLRLVGAMALVWLLCGAAYWAANEERAIAPTRAATRTTPEFHPWLYSLDLLLPLVDLQQAREWAPLPREPARPDDFWRGVTPALTWFEAIFGWAAALVLVLAVSGVTDRDRRTLA
ncbi:MAG: hypothetical protein Q8R33_15020 [Burkholderiales bacterium]|nr:hypothetical protein [Burkholderiales bacterium]